MGNENRSNEKRAFSQIPYTSERPSKPRDFGITEICDWGLPLNYLKDYLDHTGEYLDCSKIVLGFGSLYSQRILKEKIKIYHDADVKVQPGGIFFEYAAALNKRAEFLEECKEVGFDYVEVSDSRSDWTRTQKDDHIKSVVDSGLQVIPESGGGQGHPVQEIVDDVVASMDKGAWKVTVDTAEIQDANSGEVNTDLLDALLKKVDLKDIILEVWAVPIWGGHTYQIRDTEIWLIKQFGPEVNIANLMHDWVFPMEGLRRGVGININSKTGGMNYN